MLLPFNTTNEIFKLNSTQSFKNIKSPYKNTNEK